MDATTVAVDLAKDVFEVALANRAVRIIERRRLTRGQFERFHHNDAIHATACRAAIRKRIAISEDTSTACPSSS
jgi:transposase